jgi:hypothetical protein
LIVGSAALLLATATARPCGDSRDELVVRWPAGNLSFLLGTWSVTNGGSIVLRHGRSATLSQQGAFLDDHRISDTWTAHARCHRGVTTYTAKLAPRHGRRLAGRARLVLDDVGAIVSFTLRLRDRTQQSSWGLSKSWTTLTAADVVSITRVQ